ncbi:MAG: ATP-grasp domain-containing protein [Bacteroidota bacterium]
MSLLYHILFCESPFEPNKVDPDFEDEYLAAKQNGMSVLLFNYDNFLNTERSDAATKKIKPLDNLQSIIYRGWMLRPSEYSTLYTALLAKDYRLINTPGEYRNCHYLPDSLKYISSHTPKTIFQKLESDSSIDLLIERSEIFGNEAVILKDYVKSEKHDWETACFVKNASDKGNLKQTILNLISLRGKSLNEGIVIREFIKLNALTLHSKSGMPLTEEYRLFFFKNQLIGIYDYWDEGSYKPERPDVKAFEAVAKTVESQFFSMDIARKENGEFVIIELGDGQVSGLPDTLNKVDFYTKLKQVLLS